MCWLVPHQANRRIIDATASRMNLEESNFDEYRKVWKYHLCNITFSA
jgi:3-oxoacyl-[acyl-carrier-protein] synthase III